MFNMEVFYYFLFYALLALVSLFIFLYWHLSSTYNYWKDRCVPYVKPLFPFGNLGNTIMGRKSLIDLTIEQYRQFEGERFFGIFNLNKPVLVIRDPHLIERVLMTDFTYFCDRVEGATANNDFLSFYLGNLQGESWRQLRHKISGAFSNNKLKRMSEQMSKCGDSFVERISELESKKEAGLGDCLGFLFSQQIIASCVFGVESDGAGIQTFIKNVKKMIFNIKVVHLIILWYMYIPYYARLLYFIPPIAQVVEYFKNLTSATIQVRQQSQVKRNDFLQILIDLKEEDVVEADYENLTELSNAGSASGSSKQGRAQDPLFSGEKLLSNRCITSQLFMFMSLGMESSAVAIAFILCDLATNPDIQRKVQEELDEVVLRFGQLNYDALQHLNYLDCVIQECARIKPGFAYVTRVCQSPYRIPDSDVVLEKGSVVLIPTCAVHLDPVNYPDPEQFNPDRFTNNHYKPSSTYLPFGAGPRMCIAMKLVILELKIAIANVMLKHSVRLSSKTQLPIRYAPKFMPKLQNGLWLKFESRTPATS